MENFNLLLIILLVVFPIWALHIAVCIGFISIWIKVKRLENMETSLANMEQYLQQFSTSLNQQQSPIISIGTADPSENFIEMAKDAGVNINNQEELKRFFDGLNKNDEDEDDDKPWRKR